jgi:hypothetical protein
MMEILALMNILHTSLFASGTQKTILGAGFHNIGNRGVLRTLNETMSNQIELHYGERCGHLPLDAHKISVLVQSPTSPIRTQVQYLSHLFGKEILAYTFDEFKAVAGQITEPVPLVVPYINVPETEAYVREELGAQVWGLPGPMTHILKNKALFYQLADELAGESFCPPDYTIVHVQDVAKEAETFLGKVEQIYKEAGVAQAYPLGVVLRAAESDGNYGCCLVYEKAGLVVVVENGDIGSARSYSNWHDALIQAQTSLIDTTMSPSWEAHVVVSRFLDLADSPGMSVVIMDGQVESLRWNGQYQKPGSTACIGTNTYIPKNDYLQQTQYCYEDKTAEFFEDFLRKTAEKCGIDFSSLRAVANVDLMIPTELERLLQKRRKQRPMNYLAECNPRWTNYTDAILVVLGANRKEPTIENMRAVIQAGISTIDKYPLPATVDPHVLRDQIFERDQVLKQAGTRIICRMARDPMGLIFAGNIALAQQEMEQILAELPCSAQEHPSL